MDTTRRHITLLGALAAAGLPVSVRAQAGGLENARVLVGFPPGGTTDIVSRRLADGLRGGYARQAVVDNRAGAGGRVAIEQLKPAPTDGSTFLMTPASMVVIYPHIYRQLSYDPMADLQPVAPVCTTAFGFGVGPAVPASVRNIRDFVAWCKANPAQANYGSPAAGSVPHFLGALLERAAGIGLQHVAYRGSQPAVLDMLGGQLPAVSAPVGEFLPHMRTGKVRVLATSGPERSRYFPDVPTFGEQGFREVEAIEWYGVFLPGKASAESVQRLSAALQAVTRTPEYATGIAQMGLEPASATPAAFAQQVRADLERWRPIVRTIGFSADS